MKQFIKFVRNYKLFAVAAVATVIGLVLQIIKQPTIAHWVLGIVSIAEIIPTSWGMLQDLRDGKYGIDILAVTAIVASVILGQDWAAVVVVLMLTGGQSLEDFAGHRAQSELKALLKHAPVTATVIRKGKELSVPVDDIKIGDRIVVKAGEVVPVDALIIDGQANFDESSLTGESLPELKTVNALILSGSISVDGVVKAKATATAEDSQYQQIIKLVKNAAASKAPFVRLADRYSLPFTIMAYAIAISVWLVSGHPIRFLEVIIVATPCPLILAAPVALISGMARASRYGIIVKNGQALERLAESRTIAFDKTGTLTRGELTVKSLKSFGKYSKDDVLRLAASLEQNSNHVLAKAIVSDASLKKIKLLKAKHVEEVSGTGIKANIKGDNVVVGSYKLLKQEGIKLPASFKESSMTQTVSLVAVNGHLAGSITFTDELRNETLATIERLNELGLKNIVLITGDNEAAANNTAGMLGIKKVHAEALPADKLHILSQLRPKPVIFVGDGVNDAPVLTSADVGIALGARGSTAASESADMVIMLDDLSRVAVGVEIAKRTFKIAEQSIFIGIGLSLVLMLIFATGKFPPVVGALVQEIVDVFVIFNALRAHIIKPSVMQK